VDAARRAWTRFETVHAVTYFAAESRDAAAKADLRGFWMGYFGFRAAPLGPVGAVAVTAAFWNFAPRMVGRAIPDAWAHAAPAELVRARAAAAAATLERLAGGVVGLHTADLERLEALAQAAGDRDVDVALYAANAALDPPASPVARLWQACTTVREHRGDAHVAALRGAGLSGCAPHVLFAAAEGVPESVLRDNRGWTEAEWGEATAALVARGVLAPGGGVTAAGRELRAGVEVDTDAATRRLLGPDAMWVVEVLDPIARAVATSGTVPYPNPMGLPALA